MAESKSSTHIDPLEFQHLKNELQNVTDLLHALGRFSPAGLFRTDAKGRATYSTSLCHEIGGIMSSEAKDMGWFRAIHPEDRRRVLSVCGGALKREEPWKIECRLRRIDDGRITWVVAQAEPEVCEGELIGYVGSITDITDRKESEQALERSELMFKVVLDNLPERVFWKDRQSMYMGCNERYALEAGVESPQDIVGKSERDLGWSEADVRRYEEDDRRVMESGEARRDTLYEQVSETGESRWWQSSKFPLVDGTGEIVGVLGYYDDVTEKIRARNQEREFQDKLDRAERMEALGALAGGVAHDLNNMLGPLVGYPDLILRRMPAESSYRKQIERMGKSARDAADVIQDLLTLARRGRYEMKPIWLNQVVNDYLDSHSFQARLAERADVRLNVLLDPKLPAIKGSTVHLSKVIMNLALNAIDAMPDGGELHIESVSAELTELESGFDQIPNGRYVQLRVRDSGVGIMPDDIERIFEPYFSKKKLGRSGSGLGLSVVYGIIKDHKGFYDIHSEPGAGAEFVLYFPVCEEQPQTSCVLPGENSGTESILVIDDSEEQRITATELVASLGYSVAAVNGGEAALKHLAENKVDLLLLDMIMDPGIDGLDTYREIIKIHPGQKALIVTGFSATERVAEVQRLGAGGYVRKPYTLQCIAEAIRKELDRSPVAPVAQ